MGYWKTMHEDGLYYHDGIYWHMLINGAPMPEEFETVLIAYTATGGKDRIDVGFCADDTWRCTVRSLRANERVFAWAQLPGLPPRPEMLELPETDDDENRNCCGFCEAYTYDGRCCATKNMEEVNCAGNKCNCIYHMKG